MFGPSCQTNVCENGVEDHWVGRGGAVLVVGLVAAGDVAGIATGGGSGAGFSFNSAGSIQFRRDWVSMFHLVGSAESGSPLGWASNVRVLALPRSRRMTGESLPGRKSLDWWTTLSSRRMRTVNRPLGASSGRAYCVRSAL